jgi:hypothetical protein
VTKKQVHNMGHFMDRVMDAFGDDEPHKKMQRMAGRLLEMWRAIVCKKKGGGV